MIIVIGRIMKEDSLIGIRIFDTETKKTKDIRIEDKDKLKIKNIKSINKLGIVNNKQEDKPIINLGEKDNKYLTVDINGNTKILNSLEGYNSIDLLTNVEQCKKYTGKRSLIDDIIFEFETKEDTDEVIIVKYIENKEDFRVIEIPKFVTGIKIGLDSGGLIESSPFTGVKQSLKVVYKGNKITSLKGMFYAYEGSKLDLSNFNTSQVTDMSDMFAECDKLTKLDLSNFDTSQVTDMTGMFGWCESLGRLDLSKFNTSKVTNMLEMFAYCENLEELDISNFDTSKVKNMNSMFSGCLDLNELDLSNFDTSSVINMSKMFDCTDLTPENTNLKVKE